MRFSVVVGLLLLCSSVAFASFYDGHRLREMVDARNRVLAGQGQADDMPNAISFNAYVLGVFDALEGVKNICPKRGVTVDQVMQLVANNVRRLPANRLNQPADLLLGDALRAAFPCTPALFQIP